MEVHLCSLYNFVNMWVVLFFFPPKICNSHILQCQQSFASSVCRVLVFRQLLKDQLGINTLGNHTLIFINIPLFNFCPCCSCQTCWKILPHVPRLLLACWIA